MAAVLAAEVQLGDLQPLPSKGPRVPVFRGLGAFLGMFEWVYRVPKKESRHELLLVSDAEVFGGWSSVSAAGEQLDYEAPQGRVRSKPRSLP